MKVMVCYVCPLAGGRSFHGHAFGDMDALTQGLLDKLSMEIVRGLRQGTDKQPGLPIPEGVTRVSYTSCTRLDDDPAPTDANPPASAHTPAP